jgi:GNAT superfamily N-acetyltransferase
MSTITTASFSHHHDPSEEFLALIQRVEGLTDAQASAERQGTEALLCKDNTYYRNAAAMSFVASRDGEPAGRVTAFDNQLAQDERGRIGLVGLFACENDAGVAQVLLDAATDWLAQQGARVIRGPMAGDIWHRWRFMIRGFAETPFPGEPRQPRYYPELLEACGLEPVRTYTTKLIEDLQAQLDRFKAADKLARKKGYTFRAFDREQWQVDIVNLFELCQHSFATTWGVTATTQEEFTDIYNRWLRRVGPDHILLAQDSNDEVVGLGLAISSPRDTLNIRTIAVKPHHSGFGLGQAIAAELYRRAIDAGQRRVHHCLMGPHAPPQRWDGGLGVVTREYQMFERKLE